MQPSILLGTCPVLTAPANGMIECTLRFNMVPTVGDTCSYTCDAGFVRLAGVAMRTCGSNMMWSGSATVCGTGNHHP